MRKELLIYLFAAICIATPAFSQSTFQLSGKVIDKSSSEPVSFAQVAVYQSTKKKPLTGGVTGENGEFSIELQPGSYDIAVVFVGYQKKKMKGVVLSNGDKNIGNIVLTPTTQQLEEVVVQAEATQKALSTDVEGLTIRPDLTLTNVGGNLLDILRNTPSVNVSQDGSISLRGSNATNILINGRNSALATDLEQIPASAIKSIKVVTNPNAKYDAQGAGGVINIELKDGEQLGTNGKAEITAGTRYRLNSSLRLTHTTDHFNIYGGYSFRRWPSISKATTIRETFTNNQRLEQLQNAERNDLEHTINLGAGYTFGKNRISYEGALNLEKEADTESNASQIFDRNSSELLLNYSRFNRETEDNYTLDNALVYEHLFDNPLRELRALVSHSYRDQVENQNIDVFSQNTLPGSTEPSGLQRSLSDDLRQTAIAQADYVHPLINGNLETGIKSIFRTFDNDYLYEILNSGTGTWVNQTGVSNRFRYSDQVYAAYMIYSRSFNKVDLSVGTRAEQTFVNTQLYNTNETNKQSYLNLFPSLQAVYHPTDKQSIKFTYSRRIDRPGGRQLNPFPDISDSLNIRQGNPDLQPELINSLELGHTMKIGKVDLTSNVFFRHVNGQVDYIVRVEEGISYGQPANLNSSMTYGLELINTTEVFPWWSFNASYAIFQIRVDGTNLNSNFTNSGLSWNAKLTSDFQLPLDIDLQVTGNYTAPEIEAQGRDLARYYLDVSLRRTFMKEKGSLSLTLQDIFNTRRFAGESFGPDFSQRFNAKRESRIFLLSLGYAF
ncbi:TonB-dependent receptor [Rhodocytophaga aerolata]|uniref:TonB-dependent receptor n=1 Tax=Rhodocytophaga aerolata TaxID=455078 RepID=A0ABT8RIZ0_9BACT|nr:TonB-dependent receptor [Rhodocytophaga aerolata]MDO1450657.1 TonB-dependent receptor [Rhodocytophaga aerolata]